MKKIILLSIFTLTLLEAKTHVSKILPYRTYDIQSEVSGKVIYTNLEKELMVGDNKPIIEIDDYSEDIELKQLKKKIQNYEKMLKLKRNILENTKKTKSKSEVEKDLEEFNYLSLENQIFDLKNRYEVLKEIIKRKKIKVNDLYINKILINKNEYVNPGTKLLNVSDISKKILKVYLSQEEIDKMNKNGFKINDEINNDWKILHISKIKDEIYVSGYEVQLITNKDEQLSKIIKFEVIGEE